MTVIKYMNIARRNHAHATARDTCGLDAVDLNALLLCPPLEGGMRFASWLRQGHADFTRDQLFRVKRLYRNTTGRQDMLC